METCFIIQPFDGGKFDKRYIDVIKPTIEEIGLEPYRVDEDHHSNIPINDIEDKIKSSLICLADITLDNPNVWYELGYAISANKPTIMICSKERETKFPFDVQHRKIITYSTESLQDFTKLKDDIKNRATAILDKREFLTKVSSESIANVEGLAQHELVAIVAIAENLNSSSDNVSSYTIKNDIENSGFTKIAAVIALQNLERKGFVINHEYQDTYSHDSYIGYQLTKNGWNWIMDNQDKFLMKRQQEVYNPNIVSMLDTIDIDDDEIPF
jgi:nucleoside 2-deoxyribosyltransferase